MSMREGVHFFGSPGMIEAFRRGVALNATGTGLATVTFQFKTFALRMLDEDTVKIDKQKPTSAQTTVVLIRCLSKKRWSA